MESAKEQRKAHKECIWWVSDYFFFYTFLCILSAKGVFLTIKKHGIWYEKHFHMHICVNLGFLFLSLYSCRTQNMLKLIQKSWCVWVKDVSSIVWRLIWTLAGKSTPLTQWKSVIRGNFKSFLGDGSVFVCDQIL